MKIIFDKYFYQSNAASALILRSKYRLGEFGENVIFVSTIARYKQTNLESFPEDRLCITSNSLFKATNSIKLFILVFMVCIKNRKEITEVVAMSSPGFSIFIAAVLSIFFKTRYYVQDTFPDGKLFALGVEYLKYVTWPIMFLCYHSINRLITISNSMSDYLENFYSVKVEVIKNPSNVANLSTNLTPKKKVFFLSGNFSHAHGYELPLRVLKILHAGGYKLDLNGFGKNFDRLKASGELPSDVFGNFLSSSEYEAKVAEAAVFIILQGEGFERFCYTSKFTSLFEVSGSKFLYVGPECDISDILEQTQRGYHIQQHTTDSEILEIANRLMYDQASNTLC